MLGAVDIPSRGVDDFRASLKDLEVKLAEAKARRDKILLDIRKASAAIDAGDKKARFAQGALNKDDAAAGRLVLSADSVRKVYAGDCSHSQAGR
jgi:multidrug resistance efflux pump